MTRAINAAIVGLGRWGELLVSSVDDSNILNFKAAITRSPSKVEKFCAQRGITLSNNLDDVLNDDAIEALVIATPHSQHFEQLMAAAKAGKHVYCEKPWTLNADDGQEALEAFAAANLKVAIGHNRRFAPNSLAMKDVIEAGKLGSPIHIDGHFSSNLAPAVGLWRDSRIESPAGGMTSMGIHALDMFIHLFGSVHTVDVQSKRIASPIDVDDSTLVRLNFSSGCTGHLTTISTTSMLWRISVYCTGGWVECRDQDKLEVSSIKEGHSHETYPGFEYPALATIQSALESFATSIKGGADFPITPDEIGHSTRVLTAIIESAKNGKTISVV